MTFPFIPYMRAQRVEVLREITGLPSVSIGIYGEPMRVIGRGVINEKSVLTIAYPQMFGTDWFHSWFLITVDPIIYEAWLGSML